MFDAVTHHDLARRGSGRNGVLKNDGILPLNGQQTIAVIPADPPAIPIYRAAAAHFINPTQVDCAV